MLTVSPARNRLLSIDVTDPATATILETADAKKYLNADDLDDQLIERLAAAAVAAVAQRTHRSLLTQEVTVVWRATSLPLRLFRSPVQDLVSVKTIYQGTKSAAETLTNFYISAAGGLRPKLFFKDTFAFTEDDIEEIEIVYTAGFGDEASDVPADLIEAASLILNQFYDHRDNFVEGSINSLPYDACRLMSNHISPVI